MEKVSHNKESKTAKKEMVILNELGLHARPAAMFVKLANEFSSDIIVEKGSEQVNGKSIMGVMMLAAGKGSKIRVIAEGPDCHEVIAEIDKLIKSKFGEE